VPDQLFRSKSLSDHTDLLTRNMAETVASASISDVENADYRIQLIERFALRPIELLEDQISRKREEVRRQGVDGIRVTVTIPFAGSPELLTYRPSQFTFSPPTGDVRSNRWGSGPQALTLTFEATSLDADAFNNWLTSELANVKKWLVWANDDAQRYNAGLCTGIEEALAARRQRLEDLKRFDDETGQ
jgi:hypothetical protein